MKPYEIWLTIFAAIGIAYVIVLVLRLSGRFVDIIEDKINKIDKMTKARAAWVLTFYLLCKGLLYLSTLLLWVTMPAGGIPLIIFYTEMWLLNRAVDANAEAEEAEKNRKRDLFKQWSEES